ncbi:hypothetical protein AWC38_SpisGene5043 [Stylophora pistillata]|uniref:Uncharacterized protein n=1 Tax=Stylophora pistillata TaxID=50429 RepID=A0A2B4SP91_STYPI|nr:hypothetical protein AWC38_SpisGene5043 [Stylophora pistillata]
MASRGFWRASLLRDQVSTYVSLATLTRRLCTEFFDPLTIEPIVASRLIPPDKGNGEVRPSTAKQCWFADDVTGAGSLVEVKQWWDELREAGPTLGYYPNSKKCWLVVKPEKEGRVKEGRKHLGAALGSRLILSNMWVASVRERRLDLEDERKRRNRIGSDFDPGCTLRTFKPVDKAQKVRMYPWKSTRIQDLPDISNNDGFEIPISLEANSKAGCFHGHSRRRLAMGHISVPYERPELKRDLVHNSTAASTSELSETDFSLKLSSSRSADTPTNSCVVASIEKEKTGLADECYVTDIREEAIHLTHFDVDGQVVVETVNGSLLEYWV